MHAKLIDISVIIKGPNTFIEVHVFIRNIIILREVEAYSSTLCILVTLNSNFGKQ